MWNDIETTSDYLHFSVISQTVAELILESGDNPISIGVSGNWGSGKSSMVKMIGRELSRNNTPGEMDKYIFLDFNAWLYQGYDDAKSSLLQVVAKKLADEMKKRKIPEEDAELWDKFKNFTGRINWFQVSKMALPLLAGFIPGAAPVGAIATLFTAVNKSINNPDDVTENSEKIEKAIGKLTPELNGLLKESTSKSTTQQIQELRLDFEEILEKLNVKLVVLVDDLDRCLPETAISTLEAMRLLLFVNRTAFIIAADEQMIRNGVRSHFGNGDLSDELVTSYFDKLIQVPITVPHLGLAEIKVYIVLLFLELEVRKTRVNNDIFDRAQSELGSKLATAWKSDISMETIKGVFDPETLALMSDYISIADQLAGILVTADKIKGNPRLIKRFLNALEIRKKVARLNGMTLDSSVLIKMLLFERCASSGAFDYLSKIVANTKDGKPDVIKSIEEQLEAGEEYKSPDTTWSTDFIRSWLLLEPKLSEYDLRPLLYLSRDKTLSFAAYNELSTEGKTVFEALKRIDNATIMKELVDKIKNLGESEAELLFNRISSLGRSDQWSIGSLSASIHIVEAFPNLGSSLASVLTEIPPASRTPAIVTMINGKVWSEKILFSWAEDKDTPEKVLKLIEIKKRG